MQTGHQLPRPRRIQVVCLFPIAVRSLNMHAEMGLKNKKKKGNNNMHRIVTVR